MKRVVILLLVVAFFVTLAACSNSQVPGNSDSGLTGDSTPNQNDDNSNNANNTTNDYYFNVNVPVREGLLFVIGKKDGVSYCINTKGEIQFALSNKIGSNYRPSDYIGFYNGLTVVDLYDENLMICDKHLCRKDGTIIKPSDVGCDDFLLSPSSLRDTNNGLLADGYILATSGNKMGVLNKDLEWIKPLSEEYYTAINGYIKENTADKITTIYYSQGLFLSSKGYINIITGEVGQIADIEDSLEFPSDFWSCTFGNGVVKFINELYDIWEVTLDISDLYGSYIKDLDYSERNRVLSMSDFSDGICRVLVRLDGKNMFSIINEQGKQILEPIQIKGEYVLYDSAARVCYAYSYDEFGNMTVEIFNTQGKVNEFLFEKPADVDGVSVIIEDGVVVILLRKGWNHDYQLFDLTFQPV